MSQSKLNIMNRTVDKNGDSLFHDFKIIQINCLEEVIKNYQGST